MTGSRIGIFGGTFDPPHLGHVRVAEEAGKCLSLDRVIWIPASRSPHKADQAQSSAVDRLEMTRRCTNRDALFETSLAELVRSGPSFTVDTLYCFRSVYPEAEFFLILGSDVYQGFDSWKDPDGIRDLAQLVVYPRSGARLSDGLDSAHRAGSEATENGLGLHFLDMPVINISSTDIRSRVAEGRSISELVPEDVAEFIVSRGLYRV